MAGVPAIPPALIDKGLMALIEAGGNAAQAAKNYTAVSEATLRNWRNDTHAQRYRDLEATYVKEVEGELIAQARENAHRAGEIERQLIEDMASVGDRDKPAALRAITDAKTKNVDKYLTLTGRPSAIVEQRDIGSILESLSRLNVLKVGAVDSTAEEVTE